VTFLFDFGLATQNVMRMAQRNLREIYSISRCVFSKMLNFAQTTEKFHGLLTHQKTKINILKSHLFFFILVA